jgi:hypothetical protein
VNSASSASNFSKFRLWRCTIAKDGSRLLVVFLNIAMVVFFSNPKTQPSFEGCFFFQGDDI